MAGEVPLGPPAVLRRQGEGEDKATRTRGREGGGGCMSLPLPSRSITFSPLQAFSPDASAKALDAAKVEAEGTARHFFNPAP